MAALCVRFTCLFIDHTAPFHAHQIIAIVWLVESSLYVQFWAPGLSPALLSLTWAGSQKYSGRPH